MRDILRPSLLQRNVHLIWRPKHLPDGGFRPERGPYQLLAEQRSGDWRVVLQIDTNLIIKSNTTSIPEDITVFLVKMASTFHFVAYYLPNVVCDFVADVVVVHRLHCFRWHDNTCLDSSVENNAGMCLVVAGAPPNSRVYIDTR